MKLFPLVLFGLLISSNTFSAPPPGVTLDPEIHAWFERQTNQRGGPCCSVADGHILEQEEWRIKDNNYEVLINGEWNIIDPKAMSTNISDPNPTGKAVVWYVTYETGKSFIYCFTPGTQG